MHATVGLWNQNVGAGSSSSSSSISLSSSSTAGAEAMGTGSSRAKKTRSCRCSPPRSWSGPRWGSSSGSGGGSSSSSSSAPGCRESPKPRRTPASLLLESDDSDSELLDAVLAEFGEKLLSLTPRVPPPQPTGARGEGDGLHVHPQILLTESTTVNNNFGNQLPLRTPELQAPISYDYSEEELMATIEQEYCR